MTTTLEPIRTTLATQLPPPTEASRPKFHEAYWAVLNNSRLKRIIDGLEPATNWTNAINEDVANAHQFIRNFAADMSRITGRRMDIEGTQRLFSVKQPEHSCGSLKERLEKVHSEFESSFRSAVLGMKKNLKSIREKEWGFIKTKNHFLPISKIEITGTPSTGETLLESGGAVAGFTHLGVDHVVRSIQFAEPCFKPVDDFTRSIPKHAQRKLKVLESTHYDYEPKILDGVLVSEKEEQRATPFQDWCEWMQDPALAIRIDGPTQGSYRDDTAAAFDRYAIDFWREPYQGDLQRTWTWAKNNPIMKALFVWMPLAVAMFFVAFVLGKMPWNAEASFLQGTIGVLGVLAMLGVVIATVIKCWSHTYLRNCRWRL